MTQTSTLKPLGKVLQQTGLVSAEQITEALREQMGNSSLKIGEILAKHGWIKQETANFMAEKWPRYLSLREKKPLGQYLRDAGLLNVDQVRALLEEQSQTGIYFGELIVQKGWLSEETVYFFLNAIDYDIDAKYAQLEGIQLQDDSPYLQVMREQLLDNRRCDPYQLLLAYQKAISHKMLKAPESSEQSELLRLGLLLEEDEEFVVANPNYRTRLNTKWVNKELGRLRPFERVRINLFQLDQKASLPYVALEEVFNWTGREPFLTQVVCQAIHESQGVIPANEEKERISQIVYRQIIDDWQHKAASEHLQGFVDYLTEEPYAIARLARYRQALRQEACVFADDDAQQELLNLGLVVQQQQLAVANRIYAAVLNEEWLSQQMARFFSDAQDSKFLIVPPPRDLIALDDDSPEKATPSKPQHKSSASGPKLGRILLWLLVLGAVGTLVTLIINRVLVTRQVTRTFDLGNALLNRGEYEAAIATFNDVLEMDANYHQAWTNRGYALAGIDEYSQMLDSCRAATIIAPQAVYAWNCQGEAFHNLNQFEEAIAAFDQATELNSDDPAFAMNKSESQLAIDEFDPALDSIESAIAQLENMPAEQAGQRNIDQELAIAWATKGRVLHKMQNYSDAIAAYDTSLEFNESYFPALLGKGVTLKDLQQYDEANAQFELALNQPLSDNQKAELWFYSGLTYCKLWYTGEALTAFDKALELNPSFEAAQTARQYLCY